MERVDRQRPGRRTPPRRHRGAPRNPRRLHKRTSQVRGWGGERSRHPLPRAASQLKKAERSRPGDRARGAVSGSRSPWGAGRERARAGGRTGVGAGARGAPGAGPEPRSLATTVSCSSLLSSSQREKLAVVKQGRRAGAEGSRPSQLLPRERRGGVSLPGCGPWTCSRSRLSHRPRLMNQSIWVCSSPL